MGLDGTEREVWCTGGGGLERGVEGDVDERRRSLTEMVAGAGESADLVGVGYPRLQSRVETLTKTR